MLDVTNTFHVYREHARHLRNTAFSTLENRNWDIDSDFDEINRILFDRLVLNRIPNLDIQTARDWENNNCFLVCASGGGFTAMISRNTPPDGHWDHAVTMLMKDDAQIAFQRFFDWDELGLIDYRYVYGIVRSCTKHPRITDHHILIPVDSIKICVNPSLVADGNGG